MFQLASNFIQRLALPESFRRRGNYPKSIIS
jgi:hypothetical protein